MAVIDFWKKFDDNELTHSGVHHLMAIYELRKYRGYARGVDVAKQLDITRGSAFSTLKNLKDKGYITEDENKFYSLTEKGQQIVNNVLNIRHVFIQFFKEVLGLSPARAEEDACKIEHLVSLETAQQLLKFIGFYLADTPEMRKMRKNFEHFLYQCSNADDCNVCEAECLFRAR